ncbi:hypothetical protein B0T18DRAFT_10666 [Schizothecium vesticola]|uniref:Uncharacterized protein n=1 Tax=Schizothecium vesticola TaxID=314040 RepID=A0AA40F8P4_9PEZI|nr:hypothetical protein B0T18DRAFT_10666 [Schizothecium vesticola]
MTCNVEDGEAGSGWILSISCSVPTIPIYPRIIARQENMETSVPSEPSVDNDMSRNIRPHPAHLMAHGCCKDTQDGSHHSNRKPWPSGKREDNCKHTGLSLLSSHHLTFSVSERDGTERASDGEPAWSPRLPFCGRKPAGWVPMAFFLVAIRAWRAFRRLAWGALHPLHVVRIKCKTRAESRSCDTRRDGGDVECSSDRGLHLPGILRGNPPVVSILDVNQRLHSTLRWVLFPFWDGKAGTQALYGRMNQCFERAARMSSVPSFHHEDRTYEHAAAQGQRPLGVVVHRTFSTGLSGLIYIIVYTTQPSTRFTTRH